MGAKIDVKRDLSKTVRRMVVKSNLELEIIDDANTILRRQAGNIVPVIKNKRDLGKCQVDNIPYPYNKLIGHHIEDIDQFITGFKDSFFEDKDLFSEIDRQKFLDLVKDYGEKVLNHPNNLITVCLECHTKIHKNVNSHIVELRRKAWKQTKSWNNQKKIQDFFPENKKISAELSEVKEKLKGTKIMLTAKEKIIEILSSNKESNEKVVQNLTDDLDTLRRTCQVLTDEIGNYQNRLTENDNELDVFKNQLITSIKSTMLKTEFENKKAQEVELENLRQEQVEIHRESIIPNDKETPERRNSVKKACKLREILNSLEEESSIAKKKIPKLIPKLDKLESKKKTTLYYWNYDRGYMICNKDKIEILSILTKPVVTYTEDIGLTLYSEEDRFEYGRRVGKNQRWGKFEPFEDLERILEIAYEAAVRDNNINHEIVIDDE